MKTLGIKKIIPDKAVLITLGNRSWNMFVGVLTILVVAASLTPAEQGYYYTFVSLLSLQIFVDLGLTYATVQFTSHEMKDVILTQSGFEGNEASIGRLRSILIFTIRWLSVGAVLLLILLLFTGSFIFSEEHDRDLLTILGPWILLSVTSSLSLVLQGGIAFLEGCGEIIAVAKIRLISGIVSGLSASIFLLLGLKLYSLSFSMFFAIVCYVYFLFFRYKAPLAKLIENTGLNKKLDWQSEMWPYQWKIGLSWLSGFFISSIISPLTLTMHGPILAGQVGMSLQILNSLNSAGMAWISPKIPLFGKYIAQGDKEKLNNLFYSGLKQSSAFLAFALLALVFLMLLFDKSIPVIQDRLLEPRLFIVCSIVALTNHWCFAMAAYMRAHKVEPLLGVSIINGFMCTALMLYFSQLIGFSGVIYGYAISSLFIGFAGALYIFSTFLKKV